METAHSPVCLRILLLDRTPETCFPIVRAGCDFRHRLVALHCPAGPVRPGIPDTSVCLRRPRPREESSRTALFRQSAPEKRNGPESCPGRSPFPASAALYQTRQLFTGYMASPFLQPHASPNLSKFCTSPFTRKRPGECGSVLASTSAASGRVFSHHTCA